MVNQMKKLLKMDGISHDEAFNFRCTVCGKCCANRDDFNLSACDVYRAAKALGCEMGEFIDKYCDVTIGSQSKFPVVLLKMRGNHRTCPFLKDNLCSINDVKPTACKIYPLARVGKLDLTNGSMSIRYIQQDVHCGSRDESVTVREWFGPRDVEEDEKLFVRWSKMVGDISGLMIRLFKLADGPLKQIFIDTSIYVAGMIYFEYDIKKEFVSQLEANAEQIVTTLTKLVRRLEAEKANME